MRAILPGRPQSKRQALCTALWDGLRLVAYVSGNTVIILRNPREIIQTISVGHVETLSAIAIDELSGRLAICNEERVLIYNAVGRDENDLRWIQVHDVTVHEQETICSLSWGSSEELLVGGSKLWLYYLPYSGNTRVVWEQEIANPVTMAYFSNDAELIASCGQCDRLVKIWRRLSFELDSTRFDVSYLPHPAAVTDLHWRKPWHNEQNLDNLLYTFCADNQIRVWTYSDPHSLSVVQLIATIDINISIEPRRRSIGSVSRRRYVFILDSRDFSNATEKAIQQSPGQGVDHALEHLIEIANRSPEICVVFDGLGHMSVWGLENAGCKSRKPTSVFNVTLVDEVNIHLGLQDGQRDDCTRFLSFGGGTDPASLSLLVHSYTGQIDWYESHITHFFDTSSRQDRVKLLSSWSGHSLSIDHIARGSSDGYVLSWTDEGQAIVWDQNETGALRRRCELDTERIILGTIVWGAEKCVIILHSGSVSLWDVRYAYGKRVIECPLEPPNPPLLVRRIYSAQEGSKRLSFVVVFEKGVQEIWQAEPITEHTQSPMANGFHPRLRKVSHVDILNAKGSRLIVNDSILEQSNGVESRPKTEDLVVDDDGRIRSFNVSANVVSGEDHRITVFSSFDTNIHAPSLLRCNSIGKCAVVATSRQSLTIWDTLQGTCEWQHSCDSNDEIRKLAWGSTPRGNLFLFVGFSYHAFIVGQFRYSSAFMHQHSWYITQTISLRDFTTIHIGDVCWLSSGDLAIGAGNQLFVLENIVTQRNSTILNRSQSIVKTEVAAAVLDMANSILPVFHADFIEALLMQGCIDLATKILTKLYEKLKYFSEGDELSSDIDISPEALSTSKEANTAHGHLQVNGNTDNEDTRLESVEGPFKEYIENAEIWQVGPRKRQKISSTLANLIQISKHYKSLDRNATRYLYELHNTPVDQDMQWRSFVFAARSTTQEVLIDLVTAFHDGKLTWQVARRTGLFVWVDDPIALQTQLENVARAEYTKGEARNPVDCSVYYLALNKKSVLQGLWRMAYGLREKESTMKLLANNFDEPKWRATALKNAYALLSRRRFEYAAAFFLLGNSLKDAVNVCVNQLSDLQLAIAITRVWDKDVEQSQEVLQNLLTKHVLTSALNSEQGRWMAAWAYTALEHPAQALQAIVRPLCDVVGADLDDFDGPLPCMSFRANDPQLVSLYLQVRQVLQARNEWKTEVLSQTEEWDFVMRNVRWWMRAGMDYLGLQLVREWEFVPHQRPREAVASTTLVVPAPQTDTVESGVGVVDEVRAVKKKPPPTQFNEPSADSLLDSFGF